MNDDRSAQASVAARDELAGIVDLFGALARGELAKALDELAFKAGTDADDAAMAAAIDVALAEYYLVAVDADDVAVDGGDITLDVDTTSDVVDAEEFLAVGPAAFPTLPDHAEDLPHILDVEMRTVDRDSLAETVRDRLAEDADAAVVDGDERRIEDLLDVCYDLEAWAAVTTDEIRDRLTAAADSS